MNNDRKNEILEKLANAGAAARAIKSTKAGKETMGESFKRLFPQMLAYGAAASAVGGLGAAGAYGASRLAEPVKKKWGMKKMYEENPWLKKEDKRTVKKFYNTMFRFSPSIAMDPVVAGSVMRRQLEYKDVGVQPSDVKSLTDVEDAMRGRFKDHFISSAFKSDIGSASKIKAPDAPKPESPKNVSFHYHGKRGKKNQ